ncbi:MAG: hypothetical protein HYS89_02705 [Candidatus Colwellbacteria bacterium]|nr:hypothetical protein [Candidatus Colwellbacteria bacterium]
MAEEVRQQREETIVKAVIPTGTALALVHSFAAFNNLYRVAPWIDIPLHFWGGALLALFFYWFFYRFRHLLKIDEAPFLVSLILVLGWTALGGVFWEFGEFIYDKSFTLKPVQFGLADTLGDLFFDILGGLTVAFFIRLRYYKKEKKA